jgi:hypothetical protein
MQNAWTTSTQVEKGGNGNCLIVIFVLQTFTRCLCKDFRFARKLSCHLRSLHVTDDGYMSPTRTIVTLLCRTRFFLVFLSTTTKPQSSNVMMIRVCLQCSSAFFSVLCFPCLSHDGGSRALQKVLDLRFSLVMSTLVEKGG